MRHYFISVLSLIDEPRVAEIAAEIFSEVDMRDVTISYLFDILSKHKYHTKDIEEKAVSFLELIANSDNEIHDFSFWELDDVLKYLKSIDKILSYAGLVEASMLNLSLDRDTRRVALENFVRIDPKKQFNTLIKSICDLDETLQILIAQEIGLWKGKQIIQLRNEIKICGTERAKDLVLKQEKTKKKQDAKTKERKEIEYANADVIDRISNLRRDINIHAQSRLGTKILCETELLIKQIKNVKEQSDLTQSVIDLRGILVLIEESLEHGYDLGAAQEIIEDLTPESMNRSLIKLHLFLHSKGIVVEKKLYGFRKINTLLSLLAAHPEQENGLIRALKKEGLIELYTKKKWNDLHRELLKLYEVSLSNLLKRLKSK